MRTSGLKTWLEHLAVAAGYALGYILLRQLSFSHWALFSGFRLCVLLLVPMRYWPALVLGELVPLTYLSVHWSSSMGLAWSLGMLVPPIAVAMPVVRFFRAKHRLFSASGETNINALLVCCLAIAGLWDAVNLATMSLIAVQTGRYDSLAGQYFVGMYLGILTVVPLVLVVKEEVRSHGLRELSTRLAESRLALESVSLLLPALAILVWVAGRSRTDGSEAARMAMFLPVAWLALRHGWRGAAIGGAAASVAVVVSMPVEHDYDTLRAEVFIAFTTTTLLLLGGRIGVLNRKEEEVKSDAKLAFALAQKNVYLGEMQLRQASFAIEQLGAAVHSTYNELLGRMRTVLPHSDERGFQKQVALTQHQIFRLADSLYPVTWRDRGLPAALREGAIPRALDEAGISYWCDIGGRGLSQLPVSMHIALYRLACDAVAYVCSDEGMGKVRLTLRGGSWTSGRRWAVLKLTAITDAFDSESKAVRWADVVPMLGGPGAGLQAMKDRAAIFEGKVKYRATKEGKQLSIILFEPEAP